MIKILIKNLFLRPLSFLWEKIYEWRRFFYQYNVFKKNYFNVPIISIGNVTFGGTGKTPMTLWLVDFLESLNFEMIVLTRGYKGKKEHSSGFLKGGDKFYSNPEEFGDEPLLLSKNMKKGAVVVGKNRSENLKRYFDIVNPDIIIMDDGFQHLKLYRDFNIVLFDALLPIDRYKTAPLGYLREGLSSLKDADAIVLTRADQIHDKKADELLALLTPHFSKQLPIIKVRYKPAGIYNCFDEKVMELQDLKDLKICAITGIASPEYFYNILNQYGAEIIQKNSYPDHYFFTIEDLNQILINSVKNDYLIMATEKDMVKLKRLTKDERILYLKIEIDFISGKVELINALKKMLKLDSNL